VTRTELREALAGLESGAAAAALAEVVRTMRHLEEADVEVRAVYWLE
jgi:hypothetical protein